MEMNAALISKRVQSVDLLEWKREPSAAEWDHALAALAGHPLQSALWGESRRMVDGTRDCRCSQATLLRLAIGSDPSRRLGLSILGFGDEGGAVPRATDTCIIRDNSRVPKARDIGVHSDGRFGRHPRQSGDVLGELVYQTDAQVTALLGSCARQVVWPFARIIFLDVARRLARVF